MGITDILSLLGGLALFLYGMHMMSNGLEAVSYTHLEMRRYFSYVYLR